jgi:2-haloacid dehalogenase
MPITLAFDVYGTLLDTHGVVTALERIVGNKARNFSQTWRDKQLEYSFRRGLMNKYDNFSVCISDALDYSCLYYKINLAKNEKQELLNAYNSLPAFDDVATSLKQLKESNHYLYAFSNGSVDMVEKLLSAAAIRDCFLNIVSVDGIKSFKPSPVVYDYFLKESNSVADNAWLVSSNPFDVIGAISAGIKAVWVQRNQETIFDPWGIEPTLTINSLSALSGTIAAYCNEQ